MEHHLLIGGRLHVYKRDGTRYWQCSTYLAGKNRRISTKEESLSRAKEIAEDWYLELRGKARSGEIKNGKTFKFAADQFLREFSIITQGNEINNMWMVTNEGSVATFSRFLGQWFFLKYPQGLYRSIE